MRMQLSANGSAHFVVLLWTKVRDEYYTYPIAYVYTAETFENMVDAIADHIVVEWADRVIDDIAETYDWSANENDYVDLVYPPGHIDEYHIRRGLLNKDDEDKYLRNVLDLIRVFNTHSMFTFDIIHSGDMEKFNEVQDVWISSVISMAEHP